MDTKETQQAHKQDIGPASSDKKGNCAYRDASAGLNPFATTGHKPRTLGGEFRDAFVTSSMHLTFCEMDRSR